MIETETIKIDFLEKLDNLFDEIKREVDSKFDLIIKHESLIKTCEKLSSKYLISSNDYMAFNQTTGFNTASSLFPSSQNRTGGLFGASTTNQPTSTTGSLFGSSSTTTPSTTSFGFGSATATTPTNIQIGSGNVTFSAVSGQETVTKSGVQSTIQTNHQCITAMKRYEGKSLEELRLEDYQANRKFPQTTSGFGTSTGIFGSSTQPASSGFGSSNMFSSSSSSTAAKPFGGFGSSTTTTTPSTSTNIFGSQTKPAFGSSGIIQPFVVYGASLQPSPDFRKNTQPSTESFRSSRLFGPATPRTSTARGLFGSNIQQSKQQKPLFGESGLESIFGKSTSQSPLTTNKPFGGFGTGFGSTASNTASTTPAFSFGTSTTQPSQPTSSIFGQSTTQSPQATNKPFGGFGTGTGTTTTGFGSSTTTTPSTGLFGSTQQKPAFGLGSSTATTGTSGFGTSFGSTSQTGTTVSLFGSGFGNQPSATATTPFGTSAASTTPFGSSSTTGGLFGNTQPAATTTGTGLFGSSTTPSTTTTGFGSSGFGTGTQPSSQPSIFGTSTTPSTGGLFGTSTTSQPSTFSLGSGLGSTGAPSTGFSFSSQPSQSTSSLFCQSTTKFPSDFSKTTATPMSFKTINGSQKNSGFSFCSNEPSTISPPFNGFDTSTELLGRITSTSSINRLFGKTTSITRDQSGTSTQETQMKKPLFSGFLYIRAHN